MFDSSDGIDPKLSDISELPPSLIVGMIAASSVVLYLGTFWFEFVYDDVYQVLDNPSISSWHYFWSYFTHPILVTPYYRPVFSIWLRLNYALFGLHPAGWHAASVLLHAIAVVMVYFFAGKLCESPIVAALAATLFAVHPVHTENVAWVSGVCDPLMAIFFCGAFLCYLKTREGRHVRAWIALALLFYALALLSKEPAVVFPVVVAVHAFLYSEGACRQKVSAAIRHAGPFAALLAPYFWIRHIALPTLAPVLNNLSWRALLLTQPSLLWFYLKELLWPVNLSVFHDLRPVQAPGFASFCLPALVLLSAVMATFCWRRVCPERARTILFLALWTLVALSPALYIRSFAPEETVHDRYLYLPSVGFATLLALALEQLLLNQRLEAQRRWIVCGIAAALLGACALSLSQQTDWASDLALYSHGVAVAPSNITARNGLARVLTDRGDYAAAAPMFEEILRRQPDSWMADYNLGYIDYRVGRYPEAEFHLRRAINGYANDSFFHLYLGLTCLREGKLDEAEAEIRRAIALRGDRVGQHLALSLLLEEKGDRAGALQEARQEIVLAPTPAAWRRVAALEDRR